MKQNHYTDAYPKLALALLALLVALTVICTVCLVVFLTGDYEMTPPDASKTETVTEGGALAETVMASPLDTQALPGNTTVSPDVILPETPDAGAVYQDKLIFVGDSLTAHLVDRGGLKGGALTQQVWRTSNNMLNLNSEVVSAKITLPLTKEKMTIAQAAKHTAPDILIVTLGIDWGVAYLNETDFKTCYTALVRDIQTASPRTTVILQSIFPITAEAETEKLNNRRIDACNEWVKAVAEACGCPYLDTQSVLKGEGGELKAEYAVSDGIHLTSEAYQVILQYIRTHAYTD